MFHENTVNLHNGVRMPVLGLGTTHNGGYNHESLVFALSECGYRLVDTAKRYGTEVFVGQAIIDSKVDREDVFLTTKLWPTDYGLTSTLKAFNGSVKKLQTDYLDLFLLHWPEIKGNDRDRHEVLRETWRAMELLLDTDRCRAIGVSNFSVTDLEDLVDDPEVSVVPHVNQCEFHPFQNPLQIREYCAHNKIQFEGYCPLAKGRIIKEVPILKIAEKLGKTPAQVALKWSLQNGAVTIPKSTNKNRLWENFQVLSPDFYLPEEDMQILNNLPNDSSKKVIDLSGMKKTIDSDLPDGYKLNRPECKNVFPHLQIIEERKIA